MSGDIIPKSTIHASQHRVVDSQLKSLKLVTRRLQSVTKILETEVLILHRLFYKNKNQHRTALFWRNICEIRRYSQRIVSLKLLDNLQSLRVMFHGSAAMPVSQAQLSSQMSNNSARGSWTCLPSRRDFLNISTQLAVARKLSEKVRPSTLKFTFDDHISDRCQKYVQELMCGSSSLAPIFFFCIHIRSFNRSLQSGAFLSFLLTFAAISSRLKAVSLELKDICEQSGPCISSILVIHEVLLSFFVFVLADFAARKMSKTSYGDVTVEEISPALEAAISDNGVNAPEAVRSLNTAATTSQVPEFTTETLELKGTIYALFYSSSLKVLWQPSFWKEKLLKYSNVERLFKRFSPKRRNGKWREMK